jgi:hypothetical protein
MQWEYLIEEWAFEGPRRDEWPRGTDYVTAFEQWSTDYEPGPGVRRLKKDTPELDALGAEYWAWRRDLERRWLTILGDAGYELVSASRSYEDVGAGLNTYRRTTTTCFFKQPKEAHAPERPRRPIGFADPVQA